MTRQVNTVASSRARGKRSLLKPLAPSRNRTDEVVERIASEIEGGRLGPGDRLPTEQEMMAAFGVSRTVVREAVSALRAEGLVTSRQGAGVFVARDSSFRPFRIGPDGLHSIADVLKVMELRLAVEVEAAVLAAERASATEIAAIGEALERIDAAISRGQGAVNEDFAFHRAIAAATGNAHFARFLEFLGHLFIPRQSIRLELATPGEQRAYLARVQREHRRMFSAISSHDPAEARRAMRDHLSRSLERYRALAERHAGAGASAAAAK
jgi:GntR family transcriptional regulator, transcriptional repressor for pyruvate dehydrogenase complex